MFFFVPRAVSHAFRGAEPYFRLDDANSDTCWLPNSVRGTLFSPAFNARGAAGIFGQVPPLLATVPRNPDGPRQIHRVSFFHGKKGVTGLGKITLVGTNVVVNGADEDGKPWKVRPVIF